MRHPKLCPLLRIMLSIAACSLLLPAAFAQEPPGDKQTRTLLAWGYVAASADAIAKFNNKKQVLLDSGDVLVAAKEQTTVRIPDGSITLKPGSIALVRYHKGVLQLFIMDVRGADSVEARISRLPYMFKVGVGQELIVAPSKNDLDSFAKNDFTGRRQEQIDNPADGRILIFSEILLQSVITQNEVLRAIALSDQDYEQELFDQIQKTAISVELVTEEHGEYFSFDHPEEQIQPAISSR